MGEREKVLDAIEHALKEKEPWRGAFEAMSRRSTYYNRDGTPIEGDTRMDAMMKWATKFDGQDRTVAQDKTLYGEKLSTVFLGLDHNFSLSGPPILWETMLFAPETDELKRAKLERLKKLSAFWDKESSVMELEDFPEEKYNKKHYPHDQLQERYSTEAEALAGHARIKLQCLIPPRWRSFILYTIFSDELWKVWS